MNVLVVDDDQDIREVTAELFGRRGWQVTTVSSGEEALAALQDDGYDVAVLDQNMPPGSSGALNLRVTVVPSAKVAPPGR